MGAPGQGTDSVAGWLTNGEHIAEAKREQLRPIAANVYKAFGDSQDTRDILGALCQPMHKSPPAGGAVPPAERTEWLIRCRVRCEQKGYRLTSSHVPGVLQYQYAQETGDAYQGPATGPRKQTTPTGYADTSTRSAAQSARRAREEAAREKRRQAALEALRLRYGADTDA